jgi:hypothetical protein
MSKTPTFTWLRSRSWTSFLASATVLTLSGVISAAPFFIRYSFAVLRFNARVEAMVRQIVATISTKASAAPNGQLLARII